MRQKALGLGPSLIGQPIHTFTCHYCARAEGTFSETLPDGWGKTRTGKTGCYICYRAIAAYERELGEPDGEIRP